MPPEVRVRDSWIVVIRWVNSSDTHRGPWEYAFDAEQWAEAFAASNPAVSSWELGLLTPVVS